MILPIFLSTLLVFASWLVFCLVNQSEGKHDKISLYCKEVSKKSIRAACMNDSVEKLIAFVEVNTEAICYLKILQDSKCTEVNEVYTSLTDLVNLTCNEIENQKEKMKHQN